MSAIGRSSSGCRPRPAVALLRLALALAHASRVRLSGERLPDGPAKRRILRAVDRAREYLPLRAVLRFLGLSPSRFQAWRRRQTACSLDDQSSWPRTSPHRLTRAEIQAIGDMVTSAAYRHVLPHSAVRGQTPNEMYFGTGEDVPGDLTSRAAAARRARLDANRSASCTTCPSVSAA